MTDPTTEFFKTRSVIVDPISGWRRYGGLSGSTWTTTGCETDHWTVVLNDGKASATPGKHSPEGRRGPDCVIRGGPVVL